MGIFSRLFGKNEETDVEAYQRQAKERREAQSGESWHEHPSDEPEFASGTLLMTVEDVFAIAGRGTVATGKAEAHFSAGERALILNADGSRRETVIEGIEAFRRILDTAHPGDSVGILLRGVKKADLSRGTRILRM